MKPTTEDRVQAKDIIQWLVANYCIQEEDIPAGVELALTNERARLEKEKQRLINPTSPQSRKPKAEVTGAERVIVQYQEGATLHTVQYVNTETNDNEATG